MMKPVFNERTPKFKTAEEKSFKRNERSQECSTDRLQRSPKGKLSLSRQNQRITPENIYPTEARKANGQGQVTICFFAKREKNGAAFASSTRKNQEKPCGRDENLWRK